MLSMMPKLVICYQDELIAYIVWIDLSKIWFSTFYRSLFSRSPLSKQHVIGLGTQDRCRKNTEEVLELKIDLG